MTYTDSELEQVESLTTHPAWKIIKLEREKLASEVLKQNSSAKNRDLVKGDVIIHESALETIRENNGRLMGFDRLIGFVESARDKRLKLREGSNASEE